jgi:hypothetical protein
MFNQVVRERGRGARDGNKCADFQGQRKQFKMEEHESQARHMEEVDSVRVLSDLVCRIAQPPEMHLFEKRNSQAENKASERVHCGIASGINRDSMQKRTACYHERNDSRRPQDRR